MSTPSQILDASLDEQADVDLDELTRLEQVATPGPWMTELRPSSVNFCQVQGERWAVCTINYDDEARPVSDRDPELDPLKHSTEDARLIVALRNAAPKLLALARRALAPEAKGERVRLYQERFAPTPEGPWSEPQSEGLSTPGSVTDWCAPESREYLGDDRRWSQERVVEAVILAEPETPDVHRRRSEMCERFLREHGERLGWALVAHAKENPLLTEACELPYRALAELLKEFGLGK